MYRKHKIKVTIAIAVAMAFIMPGASAFANDEKSIDENKLKTDVCPNLIRDGAIFDPGDILFEYNVQESTYDNQCVGVEFDGTYFYVTSGGAGGENKLYFFQADGTYIKSVDQGTSSGWGWRDIAYDGNHMYSDDEYGLTEWYVTGLPDNPVIHKVGTIPGPISPCRAMAYDPNTDHFWTANWGSKIYEFTRNGNVINSFDNTYAVYGMAWDNTSSDGPWLWVYSQDGTPKVQISQFDPVNGVYTGVAYQGVNHDPTDLAGGACFIENLGGLGVFVGLTQGHPDDLLFGMEICILTLPPETPEQPFGPAEGVIGIEYTFSTSTTDPDGDQVFYLWDWDDGAPTDWLGPFDSGVTVLASHIWDEAGDYNITVKAKDVHDVESDWSDPKAIHIFGRPILEIGDISGGLLKVNAVIKNNGSVDATGVDWCITLDGGIILLGKETSGRIVSLPAGDEATVSSGLIIGFGKTVITVTAEIPESSDTKEQEAFVLLFFIKI